ncbi:MAG: hypothetical protein PUG48_12355 [Clostridia bacterium]|nr:hypothetical protein [Clostridia bacterium]
MTLLITIFAAVISTVVWYASEKARKMKVGVLCYMYWGAGLMWLVDAIFEYSKLGAEYFVSATDEMMNDAYLGLSAVILGLVIWVVILLVKDPKNIIKRELCQK